MNSFMAAWSESIKFASTLTIIVNKIMLNHVVLFKFKAYPAEEKQEKLNQLKSALLGLTDKIDELKYIEVGTNYELDAKSYDLCLLSHFETEADLDVYRVHPEHLKVLELVKEFTEQRAAVDYEF